MDRCLGTDEAHMLDIEHADTAQFPGFRKIPDKQCWGTGPDLVRGFACTKETGVAKCNELGERCTGFIRVRGQSVFSVGTERCYFRSGPLRFTDETGGAAGDRDCFERVAVTTAPPTTAPEGADMDGGGQENFWHTLTTGEATEPGPWSIETVSKRT